MVFVCLFVCCLRQTGDPANNGTAPTRGRCAALYLLPMSAFRKVASSEDEEEGAVAGVGSGKLPVVKAKPLSTGLTTDSLSAAIRVLGTE